MKKSYCVLFAFLCACSSEQLTSPKASWYSSNGREELVDGLSHHDAFATYSLTTNAPSLKVQAGTTLQPTFAALGQVTAVVDGKPWRTWRVTSASQTFSLPLDSVPGAHHVDLIEGGQIRAHEQGSVGFTSITSVALPDGYRLDSVPKAYKAGLVVWGDSRTVGGGCAVAGQQAWPVLLRQALPTTEIFTPGYGSLNLGAHLDTAEKRALLIQDIATRLKRYAQQSIWFEAGVNDYLSNAYTPAQLTGYYQALLPALHAALPNAKIYLQTDVVSSDESTNKLGFTLQAYRAGEAAGAKGLPYVQVLDGRQLGTAVDLSPDGVHLSEAGEARFAARAVKALL